MAVDMDLLIKIFDDAVSNGMDHAIQQYGATLTNEQKADLKKMTDQQVKDTLKNLIAGRSNLSKPAWFDTNNNNH